MKKRPSKSKKLSSGRPPTKASEALNRSILQSAAEAFLQRGFDGVSMDEIASQANTSKQAVYARYPTKVSLCAAVLSSRFQQLAAPTMALANEPTLAPKQHLQKVGMALLKGNVDPENLRLLEMLRISLAHSPDLAKQFWDNGPQRGRDALRQFLSGQIRAGALSIPDLEIAMEQFLGLILGGALFRLNRGVPPLFVADQDAERFVSDCVEVFFRFYSTQK